MSKSKKLDVQGISITTYHHDDQDFISLSDIAKHRDSERSDYILQNWMRNRSTIEFIGLWEQFNPNFNSIEFDGIEKQVVFNSYKIKYQRMGRETRR